MFYNAERRIQSTFCITYLKNLCLLKQAKTEKFSVERQAASAAISHRSEGGSMRKSRVLSYNSSRVHTMWRGIYQWNNKDTRGDEPGGDRSSSFCSKQMSLLIQKNLRDMAPRREGTCLERTMWLLVHKQCLVLSTRYSSSAERTPVWGGQYG
jgi:hypothetical protein